MSEREKVVLCWSGGKDSALALYELQRDERYEVVGLLTTLAAEYDRVSHHGVRADLLDRQAAALGLPLEKLYFATQGKSLCQPGSDDDAMSAYESAMRQTMLRYRDRGVRTVAFGDIFLERLRAYRESNLAQIGMSGFFPLWGRNTLNLVETFIRLGFQAYLSCVEAEKLGAAFAGRKLDATFLQDLPAGVDPCGEHGEYHSFVYAGPIFHRPVDVRIGEVVLRDVRYFADLLPANVLEETGASVC